MVKLQMLKDSKSKLYVNEVSMMDVSAYFLPSARRKFSENSLERSVISVIIQNQWHQFFEYTPIFLKIYGEQDIHQAFEMFLEWVNHQDPMAIHWMMPVYMLNWLLQQDKWKNGIDDKIIQEFLVASVMRWSSQGLEHSHMKRIILASKHLPEIAVCLRKNSEAIQAGTISILRISKLPYDKDRYALLETPQGWEENFKWHIIPSLT